jgi:pantothenate kinase type III
MMSTPIIFREQVDSTQSEAQRLCASSEAKAPFAVIARVQQDGRGRRGRGWSSLPGNLQMTVAIPPALWSRGDGREVASLKVAVLVARFLRERFGVRLTIKWPNDILFGGAKLGGILCESSSSGENFGELFVGIGLNIALSPDLPRDDGRTIALCEIVGQGCGSFPAAEDIGKDLASWLVSQWSSLSGSEVPSAFAEFAIEPGQYWVSSTFVGRGTDDGLSGDGALRILTAENTVLSLNSVDHDWRWEFQSDGPVVVADVGNSRIKLAAWGEVHNEVPEWQDTLLPAAASAFDVSRLRGKCVHAVSVNTSNLDVLKRLADLHDFTVHLLPKRPILLQSRYAWAEIGMDRVAAAEGFLAGLPLHERGDDNAFGLVVSAGTAITIDAVCYSGRHLGGFIVPGISTALKALHAYAPALPDLASDAEGVCDFQFASELGFSTREAILGGQRVVIGGTISGLLRSLSRRIRPRRTPRVAFTGGDARTVMVAVGAQCADDGLQCQLQLQEGLVLAGAKVMTVGGFVPSRLVSGD